MTQPPSGREPDMMETVKRIPRDIYDGLVDCWEWLRNDVLGGPRGPLLMWLAVVLIWALAR